MNKEIRCEICDCILNGKNIASQQGKEFCSICNDILNTRSLAFLMKNYGSEHLQKVINYLNKPKCKICGSTSGTLYPTNITYKGTNIQGDFCCICKHMLLNNDFERLRKIGEFLNGKCK